MSAISDSTFKSWVAEHYRPPKKPTGVKDKEQQSRIISALSDLNKQGLLQLLSTGRILVTSVKHELVCRLQDVEEFLVSYNKKMAAKEAKKGATKGQDNKDGNEKKVGKNSKNDDDSDSSSSDDDSDGDDQVKPGVKRKANEISKEANGKKGKNGHGDDDGSSSDSDSDSSDSSSSSSSDDDNDDDEVDEPMPKKSKPSKVLDPSDFVDSELEGVLSAARKKQAKNDEERKKKREEEEGKKRYILFVGNLPYDYKEDDIKKLFNKANVLSIRIPTSKTTQQPQGYAFVEFQGSKDLLYALGFHKTPVNGRSINVELTVGGGGNSQQRKLKIAKRKQSLALERHNKMKKLQLKEGQSQ